MADPEKIQKVVATQLCTFSAQESGLKPQKWPPPPKKKILKENPTPDPLNTSMFNSGAGFVNPNKSATTVSSSDQEIY